MRGLILVTAAALDLAGCSGGASIRQAQGEVARFHHELDQGDTDAIWNEASQTLRDHTSAKDFKTLLAAIHRKLGTTRFSKPDGWRVNATLGGMFTTVHMVTVFHGGSADEQFVFRSEGDSLKLVGYQVNSNALIVN